MVIEMSDSNENKTYKVSSVFFSSDDGRKFVRNVAVVIISPFVAITVLIGAIFFRWYFIQSQSCNGSV